MKRIIVLFTICSCICGMSFAQTAALNGGRIEPRQLTVQDTTSVILYSTEAASGGSAPIVYSWESSADALTWFLFPTQPRNPVSRGLCPEAFIIVEKPLPGIGSHTRIRWHSPQTTQSE